MPAWRRAWRRAVRFGVDGTVGHEETRFVVTTNVVAWLGILFTLFESFRVIIRDGGALAPQPIYWLFFNLPLFALVFVLNRAGRRSAATTWLLFGGIGSFILDAALFGTGTGQHHSLLIAAVAPVLLLPVSRDRMMWVAILLGYGAYAVFFLLGEQLEPWYPGSIHRTDLESLDVIYFAFVGMAVAVRRAWLMTEARADEERARSEHLLRNILPESIVHRLEGDAGELAERFEDVSVLFADIVGFTPLAESMSPEALLDVLDDLFRRFDEAVAARGLEKIKTIGDAYMVVGGAPVRREGHLEAMVDLGAELLRIVEDFEVEGEVGRLRVRVGVHVGPAVAGVIGRSKCLYDLWGDTVNVASRLESHGVPGRVQVSGEVARALAGRFDFEARGEVELKGKGPTPVHLLGERLAAAPELPPPPPVEAVPASAGVVEEDPFDRRGLTWLRPIARLGVGPGLDPRNRWHLEMVNLASVIGATACIIGILPHAVYLGDPAYPDQPMVVANFVVQGLLWLPPLWFTARGRVLAAARCLAGMGLFILTVQTLLFATPATGMGIHFITLSTAPFLIVPRESEGDLWTFVIAGFLGMVFSGWWTEGGFALYPGIQVPPGLVETGLYAELLGLALAFRVSTRQAEARLRFEHARAEGLLLNILPVSIAGRLKAGEARIADQFDDASVLFADITDFTELASTMAPEELVARLDALFTLFDVHAERLGLEKIKTIGDAYMVAGGVPDAHEAHLVAMARMALAVRDEAAAGGAGFPFRLRIGFHAGPVVAGVIGRHKFAYDLWGDTVNLASRMESHGEPGRIQVTDAVRQRLGDTFEFESRGELEIKGKGRVTAWFLIGERARAESSG